MTVRIDQLKRGIAAFVEQEMCAKASGFGQFAAYFALPSIPRFVEAKFAELQTSPLFADVLTPDGALDLDAVRDRARVALDRMGSLEVMGFKFSSADIDSLYEYIRRA